MMLRCIIVNHDIECDDDQLRLGLTNFISSEIKHFASRYIQSFMQQRHLRLNNFQLYDAPLHNGYLWHRVQSTLLGSRCVIMTRGRRPSVIIHIVSLIKYFAPRFIQRFMPQRHLKFANFAYYDAEWCNSYLYNWVINAFLGTRCVDFSQFSDEMRNVRCLYWEERCIQVGDNSMLCYKYCNVDFFSTRPKFSKIGSCAEKISLQYV